MATTATDINLSTREATRLVDRLRHFSLIQPSIMRDVLRDLPDADIDVIRGVIRIAKKRIKAHGSNHSAVI